MSPLPLPRRDPRPGRAEAAGDDGGPTVSGPARGGSVPGHELLADALLRAEAAVVGEGALDVASLVHRLAGFGGAERRAAVAAEVAAEVQVARAACRTELTAGGPLAGIVAHARLRTAEAELLAVLVAVERSEERQALVSVLLGRKDVARPTVGLVRRLLGDAGVAALAPDGALRRAALVAVQADVAWARAEVVVHPRVVWAVEGDASPDPALPPWVRPLEVSSGLTAGADVVLVPGPDLTRRTRVATTELRGHRFLVGAPPTDGESWSALVREATVTGRSVILHLDDEVPAEVAAVVERAGHLAWALCSRAELPVGSLPRVAWREVRAPESLATAAELHAAFGDRTVPHRLTAHQAEQSALVLAGQPDAPPDEAVRRLASGELDRLAVRVRPRRGWVDLVLPDEHLGLVREVVTRYRHRNDVYGPWGFSPLPSAGVVAMFAGPPGTGKTLSAEIVAGELGLDLFRVDLAALVSKYVGETEKNLERVFRAAEGGTMVLLFDEADAVFGKRSEVSDANDRYANVETSYLLQRLESYDGVVVLTTNYASNIDQAFLRRIHVSVEFPAPDEAERLRLWAQVFPGDAPLGDLDVPFLARQFKLTGAQIRSVALGAAFRAAAAGTTIAMPQVLAALHAELRKQGRLPGAVDFGPYADLLPAGSLAATPRTAVGRRHG